MEILNKINFKYVIIVLLTVLFIFFSLFYFNYKKNINTQSSFDLYLANSYNDLKSEYVDANLNYLSSLKNPNISFFADLKKQKIDSLEKYKDFEGELIAIKNAVIESNTSELNKFKNSKYFSETSSIYYFNNNLDQLSKSEISKIQNLNFFEKAIKLYLNDI